MLAEIAMRAYDEHVTGTKKAPDAEPGRTRYANYSSSSKSIADRVAHERTGAARERTSTHEAQRLSH